MDTLRFFQLALEHLAAELERLVDLLGLDPVTDVVLGPAGASRPRANPCDGLALFCVRISTVSPLLSS